MIQRHCWRFEITLIYKRHYILKLNLILFSIGLDEPNLRQRQTTILMNHPLGAVEYCVGQDYTVTVPSNQGMEKRDAIKLLVCVQEVLICTHIPKGGGLGPFIPTPIYPRGDLCTERGDNHFGSLISCLFSTYPVIGVIEKVTWHWRWWDLLGNIKGHVLCQKTFMMCKLNIVQCIYRRFSDMRLMDVWRTECLSSIWIFHQIANTLRQFEWSTNAFN